MKEKLTNNLGLKLLSVGLAVFAWFMVVNVVNPLVEASAEVPVEIINEDILKKANLTYEMIGKKTVTVSYEVRSRDRYRVSASDFTAYADLAYLYDVTGSIPVTVEISNRNVRSVIEGGFNVKPAVVRIQTEELQRKKFNVIPHLSGEAEEGYDSGGVTIRPEEIYVTGAVSVIGQISSVGVEIDISDADSDVTGTGKIVLYDANGNQLPDLMNDVTLNRMEVDYQVSILKVKNVGLGFQVTGEAAEGYRFTGVDCDVKSVSVEGLKSVLASLNTIVIPEELLNIDGAAADITVEVDLIALLPDNISMAEGSATKAVITLRIEKLEQRSISFNTRDLELIGTSEDLEYHFEDEQTTVWIRGLSEDLDKLDVNSLVGQVDVSALTTAGDYEVDVYVELSEGFDWVSSDWLQLYITEKWSEEAGLGEIIPGEESSSEETNSGLKIGPGETSTTE